MSSAPRPPIRWGWLAAIAATFVAPLALDWRRGDDPGAGAAHWREWIAAFAAPDLSASTLAMGARLTLDTLAIALWGALMGAVLGWSLAALASQRVQRLTSGATTRVASRVALALARLALDVLRGVPDFAWALLLLTLPGPGPVTGACAIALSTAGLLGKVYSEQWDALELNRARVGAATGASGIGALLYVFQPAASRSMASYTLMRAECAVRNASVIGAVGGGGLGGSMLEHFGAGEPRIAVTLLLFLLCATASVDLLSNALRARLREDPSRPRPSAQSSIDAVRRRRRGAAIGLALAAIGALVWTRESLARALEELSRVEWSFIATHFGGLLRPELSRETLTSALASTTTPLALAWLGTLLSATVAASLSWPGSSSFQLEPHRFAFERTSEGLRRARMLTFVVARALALVLRAIPDVAWLLVIAACLRAGTLAGLLALAAHSAGVLARVFAESLDNVPYRQLEPANLGGRASAFVYGALPRVRADWLSYSAIQFESNVRAGVMLGILGLGGLGERFHSALGLSLMPRAGAYLVAMVLLTALVDRISRLATRDAAR